jgi:FKBP-type peptidyl-prolyl isomerase-like protein
LAEGLPGTWSTRAGTVGSLGRAHRPRRPGGAINRQVPTKLEKRAASKARRREALARQARAQRRRQTLIATGVGLGIVVLVVGLFWLVGPGRHHSTRLATVATPTASAAFPSLPSGADARLASKPTVSAGTGTVQALKVTPLIQGTGPTVQSGQKVTVNYVGATYADGHEFDSSWKISKEFSFTVGNGEVIKGWDEGLVGVTVGSRVQLDIPASQAYGEHPQAGYPAGALRFVVDVLAAEPVSS